MCLNLTYENEIYQKFGEKEAKAGGTKLFGKSQHNSFQEARNRCFINFKDMIDKIIVVCINNNDSTDEIWYMLLDVLIQLREDKIQHTEPLQFMREICTEKICEIITTIAKSRNMDTLLQQLQNRYTQLDLGQIKESFIVYLHTL
jgi:hypothetical protein